MIRAEIHLDQGAEEDLPLGVVYMRFPPHNGELLWFAGRDVERLKDMGLPSSYRVVDVAHWIGTAWTPNTHVGEPIHTLYVAVERTHDETGVPATTERHSGTYRALAPGHACVKTFNGPVYIVDPMPLRDHTPVTFAVQTGEGGRLIAVDIQEAHR